MKTSLKNNATQINHLAHGYSRKEGTTWKESIEKAKSLVDNAKNTEEDFIFTLN